MTRSQAAPALPPPSLSRGVLGTSVSLSVKWGEQYLPSSYPTGSSKMESTKELCKLTSAGQRSKVIIRTVTPTQTAASIIWPA